MEQIRNEAFQAEADLPPAVYKGDLSVAPHQGWHSWPRLGTQGGLSMLTVTLHRRQAAHPQHLRHRQAHLFLSPPTLTHDLRSQGTPGQSPGQSGVRGGYSSKVCPRTPGPSPAVSPGPTAWEPSGPQPSSSHQTPLPLLSPRHSRPQGSRVQSQGRVGRHVFWLFVV